MRFHASRSNVSLKRLNRLHVRTVSYRPLLVKFSFVIPLSFPLLQEKPGDRRQGTGQIETLKDHITAGALQ